MNKFEILSTNNLKIDYFYNSENLNNSLAFVFSPSFNRELDGNLFGGNILFKNGFDVVNFKNSSDDWFQSVPSEIFLNINNRISEKHYKKIISYGTSMGGYAAIAFSKLLNPDLIIALGPQYSIDEDFDKRWFNLSKEINFVYRINKDTVKNDCEYFIVYDNKSDDEAQIKKLLEVLPQNKCFIKRLPYTGHSTAHFLDEIGVIKTFLIKIALHNSFEEINFSVCRKKSKTYLMTLSDNLSKRKHLKLALDCINLAINIDNNNSLFFYKKALILDSLGMCKEAIHSLELAILINPEISYYVDKLHGIQKSLIIND